LLGQHNAGRQNQGEDKTKSISKSHDRRILRKDFMAYTREMRGGSKRVIRKELSPDFAVFTD
jgi:hypothetical protein